jgi:hypothetical protein
LFRNRSLSPLKEVYFDTLLATGKGGAEEQKKLGMPVTVGLFCLSIRSLLLVTLGLFYMYTRHL